MAWTYFGAEAAPSGDARYRSWLDAIKAGRISFGDGRSHAMDLRANDRPLGSGPLEHPPSTRLAFGARGWDLRIERRLSSW